MDYKKLTEKITHTLPPKPNYADDTPLNMAEGFSNLAKMIGKELNKHVHDQQNKDVDALFHTYRANAIILWEHAKHIGIEMDAVYTLTGRDNYAVLCRVREWCERSAAILRGETTGDEQYIKASEAIKYAKSQNRKIAISTLTKKLDDDCCPVRFEQLYSEAGKKRGKKIHFGDFKKYIETLPKIKADGNDITGEAIEEYLENIQSEHSAIHKEKEKSQKKSNPRNKGYELLKNKISGLDV